jgi:5'-3' exonuclease
MSIIIDGSHFLNRACYGVTDDKKQVGFAITVFVTMVQKTINELGDYGVIVCWDKGLPLWRREQFSNYKPKKHIDWANGEKNPLLESDLNKMSPQELLEHGIVEDAKFLEFYKSCRQVLHERLLSTLGVLSIRIRNVEADDIASVLCETLYNDETIYVVSGDQDWLQLVDDNKDIKLYDPQRDECFEEFDVKERYEYSKNNFNWRKTFILQKALMGDVSDGIIGINGIGKKIALDLSEQISCGKSLDEVVKPSRCSEKVFNSFKENYDSVVRRNYNLIDLNYPIRNNSSYFQYIADEIINMDTVHIMPNAQEYNAILREFDIYKIIPSYMDFEKCSYDNFKFIWSSL